MTYMRVQLITFALCTAVGVLGGEASAGSRRTHVVKPGQTLWHIAKSYGCKVNQFAKANRIANESLIRTGQTLRVPSCGRPRVDEDREVGGRKTKSTLERRVRRNVDFLHRVGRGETLSKLASRYDTSIAAIKRANRLRGDVIRPGQELAIKPGLSGKGRPVTGQSFGWPKYGRLRGGIQLPAYRGYHLRRPHRSWGTAQLVYHTTRIAKIVRGKFPGIHKVAIGDASRKRGGKLSPHSSHQSGRDIDIGFYFKKAPQDYPKYFHDLWAGNAHMTANWTMFRALAATANQPGGVDRVFLDYGLQRLFYKWGKKRGVSHKTLSAMFQYPRGKASPAGIFRHEPGHRDHIHVRFRCPKNDSKCH